MVTVRIGVLISLPRGCDLHTPKTFKVYTLFFDALTFPEMIYNSEGMTLQGRVRLLAMPTQIDVGFTLLTNR